MEYIDRKELKCNTRSGNKFISLPNKKGSIPIGSSNTAGKCYAVFIKTPYLFAGGNADFDVFSYLKLLQKFRTVITVIPIGNINRPRYVKFLKESWPGDGKK